MNFLEYVTKKQRATKDHLKVLKQLFEKNGFVAKEFLEEDDEAYLYVKSSESSTFGGIRIYEIGDNIAYRVQREESTHPYGKAYTLNVEEMYEDLISDHVDEKKAGKEVTESIVEEIKKFFVHSAEAEKETQSSDFDVNRDPIITNVNGGNYASKIFNKSR